MNSDPKMTENQGPGILLVKSTCSEMTHLLLLHATSDVCEKLLHRQGHTRANKRTSGFEIHKAEP